MPFSAIDDPEQRAILNAVLNDICRAAGIERDAPERNEAANLVMQFYGKGYRTADELMAAFNHAIRQERFDYDAGHNIDSRFPGCLKASGNAAQR